MPPSPASSPASGVLPVPLPLVEPTPELEPLPELEPPPDPELLPEPDPELPLLDAPPFELEQPARGPIAAASAQILSRF